MNTLSFLKKKPKTFYGLLFLCSALLFLAGRAFQFFELESSLGSCHSPAKKKIEIINRFPHDSEIFTQGFIVHDQEFYESGGRYGVSSIQKYSFKGKSGQLKKNLSPDIFAEGLSLLGDKLYLLSWKAEGGFMINPHHLEVIDSFEYKGEGWGLSSFDNKLYMSNGSSSIQVFDSSFHKLSEFEVRNLSSSKKVEYINELEFIEGRLYANIWHSTDILGIDIEKACVVEIIDASELLRKEQDQGLSSPESVLNGIAYDKTSKSIYLTGKLWNNIYQVKWN